MSEATRMKMGHVTAFRKVDDTVMLTGHILLVFFIILTTIMATTLILFAVGFFMAVTHWCDRSVRILSASHRLGVTVCRIESRLPRRYKLLCKTIMPTQWEIDAFEPPTSPKTHNRFWLKWYCIDLFERQLLRQNLIWNWQPWVNTHLATVGSSFSFLSFITGPPTHSVGGRLVMVVGVCRRLSASSVVCNAAHMQRNSPGAARGGPVVLRPVSLRATPCWFVRHCTNV